MANIFKKYQKFTHQFFRDLTSLGSFVSFFILVLFVLAFQEQVLALKLFLGMIITLIGTVLIRMFYFKNRPHKQEHTNFIEKIDASSFPSLHTARIVFLALIMTSYFKQGYLTVFFVLLAGLVAYSRIYLKKHNWLDLSGGVVLGMLTYWLVNYLLRYLV